MTSTLVEVARSPHDISVPPTAVVTGASRGLGRALTEQLAHDGWRVVVDARHPSDLTFDSPDVTVVPGDVADPGHRRRLAEVVDGLGGLDLLVNNASLLGPSPQPRLLDYPLDVLTEVLAVNVVAPLALVQVLRPFFRDGARVIDVSSDAAVEAMDGWGGYGASKAALDHLSAVLAVEDPQLRVYAVDPGDMRTAMHQAAFPGEDITDRPLPETVVPALAPLVAGALPERAVPRRGFPGDVMIAPATRFVLPADREATAPPERRGLARDGVRLLVAGPDGVSHERFTDLEGHLRPGDLLVVNTSATLPAALDARRAGGAPLVVHVSTTLDDGSWVVEPRRPDGPDRTVRAGDVLLLDDAVRAGARRSLPRSRRRGDPTVAGAHPPGPGRRGVPDRARPAHRIPLPRR